MSDWSNQPAPPPFGGTSPPTSPDAAAQSQQVHQDTTGGGSRASQERINWFAQRFNELRASVETFIKGKTPEVSMALVCMMAEGHLLIDDVPGVGKTSLAKAIAHSIGGSMTRIQFTPDLLPSDVTGTQVWNAQERQFEFREGPVFANVVVGDEINRASPKTQSALLEVMEERQVTVDGDTYEVPSPFLVIATQNPVDFDGTYNLPEAQIDRFLMKLSLGYPDHDAEVEVIRNRVRGLTTSRVEAVMNAEQAATMSVVAREVHVATSLHDYAVTVCSNTRKLPETRLGVSPRGSVALVLAAQSLAASQARTFVTVDDIKVVAPHVLGHRLLLKSEAELAGKTPTSVVADLMAAIPVPDDRVGV